MVANNISQNKENVMKKFLLSALMLTSMISYAFAYNVEPKLKKALEEFDKGVYQDDEDALDRTIDRIEKLIQEDGTNASRESFLGSAISKKGAYALMPWNKLKYANEGSQILDNAMRTYPNDIALRISRAETYMTFPSFLGKSSFVQQDIRYLNKRYKDGTIPNEAIDDARALFVRFFLAEGQKVKADEYMALIQDEGLKIKAQKYYEEGN